MGRPEQPFGLVKALISVSHKVLPADVFDIVSIKHLRAYVGIAAIGHASFFSLDQVVFIAHISPAELAEADGGLQVVDVVVGHGAQALLT